MNLQGFVERILWRVIQSRVLCGIRPRILRAQPFLLKGRTEANLELTILVLADYENIVNYVANLAYIKAPQITPLERTSYHKIHSAISDSGADMVVAEFDGVFSSFFSKDFLILPRVNFTLDISPSLDTIITRTKRVRRRNIRKIGELPYTYEATKNPEDLDFFYHYIYLPFASKTSHSDFARLTPFSTAKEWFQKGELLFVKSGGNCLCGLLYHPENSTMHCRLIAFTEGFAGQAAFYHLIQTSKNAGYTQINYGETSPFMSDGLYFYKKSWGMKMKPKVRDSRPLALKLCNFGEAVQGFLINNPFIFTDFENLTGLILLDYNNISLDPLYKRYFTPGLQRLTIISPSKNKDKLRRLTSQSCVAPRLDSLDSLAKLASSMGFEVRTFDFSTVTSQSEIES